MQDEDEARRDSRFPLIEWPGKSVGAAVLSSYNPSNLPNQDTSSPLHAWHVLLIYARASKVNTT